MQKTFFRLSTRLKIGNLLPAFGLVPALAMLALAAVATAAELAATNFASASCPSLTHDTQGHVVLSFIQEKNSQESVVAYAISDDQGQSFKLPIEIPSSRGVYPHGESAPKLIFKASGEVIAVWGISNPRPANKYSGLVRYAQSFDGGKTFGKATALVRDPAGVDQRYFDVAVLPSGEAGITWLDSRKKSSKKGSSLYFAATRGRQGFQSERPLYEGTCECCRTALFVDHANGIHAAFRALLPGSIRDMVHMVSKDGGKTFSQPVLISADGWKLDACPHTGPSMAENKNGLHFAWFTLAGGTGGIFYAQSHDDGQSFTPRQNISSLASARHPQMAVFESGDLAIAWDDVTGWGDAAQSRIGVQRRDADGKVLDTNYFGTKTGVFSFPVIQAVGPQTLLLAYTDSQKGSSSVKCLRKRWPAK